MQTVSIKKKPNACNADGNVLAYEEELNSLDINQEEKDMALSKCFGERGDHIPKKRADTMLSFVEPAPLGSKWMIESSEFEEMLASKREAAPGPDGLPGSVCRSAGGIGANSFSMHIRQCRVESLSLLAPQRPAFFHPER